MKIKIEDIKNGDIFIYNDTEMVSADSKYYNGCLFVWVFGMKIWSLFLNKRLII